jgi:peptidoglycan-N-acetylglucosamine deacetylase
VPPATSILPTAPPLLPPTETPPPPTAVPVTAAPATDIPVASPPPMVEASGAPSQVIEYGTSGRREIALTFDAGADRGYAAEILDLLQAEGILASFGIMGQWAEDNPDLVRRMVDEGHLLFNHSWSHPSFTGATTGTAPLSREERAAEVRRTEQVVRERTGYELQPYFRPPYGDIDASVLADLGAVGYGSTLLWSCDSRDSLGATVDEIMANCIETAQPGRIVLLHVGAQSAAYEALPRMIDSLRAQGFAFVTADQIARP